MPPAPIWPKISGLPWFARAGESDDSSTRWHTASTIWAMVEYYLMNGTAVWS